MRKRDSTNTGDKFKLFRVACEDLNCLAEMEYNGMLFDKQGARTRAFELKTDIDELKEGFKTYFTNFLPSISSNSQLSTVLYGGTIVEKIRIAIGEYKTGKKIGEIRYKIEEVEHNFERLVQPIKGTETAKSKKDATQEETQWSVAEDVLKGLKAKGTAKDLIQIVLKYRELEKLRTTYLEGWSNLIETQHWENDMIHGNLNQCVAETGRLSSTKPNTQNTDKETKKFLVSRYN